jgi:uncharacterized LabA/DUF88 family protein
MKQTVALIDGFNVYHSIADRDRDCWKWINYRKLVENLTNAKLNKIQDVFYFTAICPYNKEKSEKHNLLIKANKEMGVETIKGRFKKIKIKCRSKCKGFFDSYTEKQTDVHISVKLLEYAFKDDYEAALIVSGDSDYVPAIKMVKRLRPNFKIGVIFPPNRKSNELRVVADFTRHIDDRAFNGSLLDKVITSKSGKKIECPPNWTRGRPENHPLNLGF